MENKQADNALINMRQEINKIDNKIDIKKQKIKKMEYTQEELISLNRNMDKCINLLSKSMKGPNTNYLFDDMRNSNKMFFLKTASILDEQIEDSRKDINQLYQKKDEINKENK